MSEKVAAIQREPVERIEPEGEPVFGQNLDLIRGVRVRLEAVVGECEINVGELFELRESSVVKLDRDVSAPVDLLLDGRVVARGTLVAVEDNFGIRITELSS